MTRGGQPTGLTSADAGDIAVNPFDVNEAMESAALELTSDGSRLVTIGGDHAIALPLLRVAADRHGPVPLVHFDPHLDTWDTYFGAQHTHGAPFRRAVEEGLPDTEALSHVGTRGPLYGKKDLEDDGRFGFGIVTSSDVYHQGVVEVVEVASPTITPRTPGWRPPTWLRSRLAVGPAPRRDPTCRARGDPPHDLAARIATARSVPDRQALSTRGAPPGHH